MYDRELSRLREKIRTREYVMRLHAEEEMNADGYSIQDVEHGVLSGYIQERQRDRETGESKYRVRGETATGIPIELIVKFGPTGKAVILTVFEP